MRKTETQGGGDNLRLLDLLGTLKRFHERQMDFEL